MTPRRLRALGAGSLAAIIVASCSHSSPSSSSTTSSSTTSSSASPVTTGPSRAAPPTTGAAVSAADGAPRASAGCRPVGAPTSEQPGTPPAVSPGLSTVTIQSGGSDRSFTAYLPASYSATKPAPIVFDFHGFGSNAAQQMVYGDFRPLADAHGLIVVAPNGQGQAASRHFNLTNVAGEADDVAFTLAVLDRFEASMCVDTRRVYSAGMSDGGGMTSLLACRASDRFAAFGPVAVVSTTPSAQRPARSRSPPSRGRPTRSCRSMAGRSIAVAVQWCPLHRHPWPAGQPTTGAGPSRSRTNCRRWSCSAGGRAAALVPRSGSTSSKAGGTPGQVGRSVWRSSGRRPHRSAPPTHYGPSSLSTLFRHEPRGPQGPRLEWTWLGVSLARSAG